MAALLCLAALQEPGRWHFPAGSWVEMDTRSLRVDAARSRTDRVDAFPGRRVPAFSDGLQERSRRADVWQGRPCVVVEYDGARLWLAEGVTLPARDLGGRALPPDAVRAERTLGDTTWLMDVLELSIPVEAAGRSFDCALEASTSFSVLPSGTRCLRSWRRWLSADVPGHVVRQDRQCTGDPSAIPHVYDTRDELRAFHIGR